ncbi:MAG: TonB-dependent siderophore receptor [Acidobacteriota bacterium]
MNSKKQNAKRRMGRERRRGVKYWIALCAMSAVVSYTPIGRRSIAFAHPAYPVTVVYSQNQSAALPVRKFDIPPGALGTVLAAFEKTSGLKFVVPLEAIRSIASPGVSGVYTVEQALKQILNKTDVTYRFTSPETATLELSSLASSIEIEGRAATLSSPKYSEPLRDIPQTIAIIPKSVIEEQGATTLRDVLRNVPGLTITAGEGGAPAGDNLTLRGFSARNDIFVDGARDLGPQSRDPFNLEQVEVIKGPSSAFNGRGSTGGTINLVSKSPELEPSYGFTLNFGSDRTKRVTGDINVPLKKIGLGERTAFRLSVLGHDSGIAGRDVVENQRWGVAPSLSFGLGTQTRLTLSYYKLKQDNISDYGIPWVTATHNVLSAYRDRPAPVPRETFYGFRDRDFEKLNSDLATVRFEREVGDTFTLRNQLRYGRSTRDSNATPPRFASNDSTVINRELRAWSTKDQMWDNQTDARAMFSTAGIQHTLTAGLALTNENNIRQTRTGPNSPTTLLNPNPDDIYTGVITNGTIVGDVTGKSVAAYAFDTARFGEKFEVNGGLRWDRFDVDGISTTGAVVRRVDKMTSWRAGAVYKPKVNGSIYASYGTSLNPSLEGLSYGTANTAIDPEKSRNFEVGTKWDIARERLSINAALFRVLKTNARTPGLLPDDPPQVLQGEQRVQGLELAAVGSVTSHWRVFAAYTFMDSKVIDSNLATEVGKALINTPRNSFNIWNIYSVGKLTLGGGPRFVGKRYGNNINTRFVDNYWTLDAMVSYPVAKQLDLRLNLYNLNNAYYFDRLGGGHLIPGAGRSVMLSTSFHF